MSETQKNKKPNVPNLRFPGFEGEWESCELGEIAEFSKGAGISKDQRSSDGNPCILYGELYTTYLTEIIDEVVSKTNLDPTGLVRSKVNDIIIPASGETAIDISTARCVLQDDVLLGGDLNIIRLFNQDGRFFSYQLNGVRKKDIARIAHGVSIVHLHGNALSHITVNYPSRSEQEKISSLLSLIDQRIAIQNKVIEVSLILKKVLCHKLFDSSKNSVSLASIADIEMGQSPDSSSYNRDSLGIPLIQGNLDIKDGNTAPSIWTTQITKQCEIGDVILTVRAPVGEVAISSHNACIGRGVCRIRSRSSTLSSNIFQYLSFFSDWGHYEQGSTFTAINRKDIEKLSIPLLSPHELRLLSNIDEHLRISRFLLRKYCSFKDSCLKQMFV